MTFPSRSDLTVQFAHSAYGLAERFALRETGIAHFQSWTPDETAARLGEADVMVCSGFWENAYLEQAKRLAYIQGIAAGYERFDLEALGARGVRFANATGVNARAVAHHAMAMILSLVRQLHLDRDNQTRRQWRGMIGERAGRQDELTGKTLLIYGAGTIGTALARCAKGFEMTVIGIKRNRADPDPAFDALRAPEEFLALLPQADYLALTCPLTAETANLINAETLAALRPDAYLFNLARGGCVDEAALIAALEAGALAGAGIDTMVEEPLPTGSKLWGFENVLITPHSGGETRSYEDNVVDLLLENLERLWRGETDLRNQIV